MAGDIVVVAIDENLQAVLSDLALDFVEQVLDRLEGFMAYLAGKAD